MGGEDLDVADVDARGFVGDRWYAVQDGQGRLASGKDSHRFRRRDPVFGFSAHTRPEGGVVVTRLGGRWHAGDPDLDHRLSDEMGTVVRVVAEGDTPHQDAGAVSLVGTATLRWCADRWGGSPDPRRIRVNIVIDTDEPFVEERWVQRELGLGSTRLHVVERVPRCRMIDIRQDSVEPGVKWLKSLTRERDMSLAVYADVIRPGQIRVGDQPQLR
jgi:uncharacterized protein YcbX